MAVTLGQSDFTALSLSFLVCKVVLISTSQCWWADGFNESVGTKCLAQGLVVTILECVLEILYLWMQAVRDMSLYVWETSLFQQLNPALTLVSYFSKTKNLASPHMEIPSQPPDLGTGHVSFHTHPLPPGERQILRRTSIYRVSSPPALIELSTHLLSGATKTVLLNCDSPSFIKPEVIFSKCFSITKFHLLSVPWVNPELSQRRTLCQVHVWNLPDHKCWCRFKKKTF